MLLVANPRQGDTVFLRFFFSFLTLFGFFFVEKLKQSLSEMLHFKIFEEAFCLRFCFFSLKFCVLELSPQRDFNFQIFVCVCFALLCFQIYHLFLLLLVPHSKILIDPISVP